jgi:hypothetical protein
VLLSASAHAAPPQVEELALRLEGQTISALWMRPAEARALLVLAHGATMNMRDPFMESLSLALAQHGIATLRFNFPYAEAGRSQPDGPPLMQEALRAAVAEGARRRGSLPLLVGGKSLGALAAVRGAVRGLPPAQGLVILGFPLHMAGRPSALNARALEAVPLPMLFLQGSRDPLADLPLMRGVVEKIGPRASLYVVEGADHQYARSEGEAAPPAVIEGLAGAIAKFAATLGATAGG